MKNSFKKLVPPKAQKRDFFHKKFGDKILDPYHWLKNRDAPEVLNYLEEENKYAKEKLRHLESLKARLYGEMRDRLPKKENQEPVPIGDYMYYRVWEKQRQYPIHKRKRKSDNKEQIILDENSIKTKSGYLDVGALCVSTNHDILAYALDEQGREIYNIYFKDLKTDQMMEHFIPGATSDFVWSNDNRTLFYIRQDKETLRAFQVYRFHIETGKSELVFEEKDLKFSVSLNKTLCKSWITILSFSRQSTEYRYLSADRPEEDFALFCQREKDHEYYLHYGDGFFYILSNKDQAFNFKLMEVAENKKQSLLNSKEHKKGLYPHFLWKEFIPHRKDVFIENYEVFKDFISLETRLEGWQTIEVIDRQTLDLHRVHFPEEIYSIRLGDNKEYKSLYLRLRFQSLTQPPIVYDYEVAKRELHFKSQMQVKGGFCSKNYVSQAEYALAEDGSKIPISLVYKKDLQPSSSTPLLLYAYGSYGISMNPGFKYDILSLLDRGFVYAQAHIRGGSEKGRKWYEDGRLLNKKNTFSDFICCAEYLINKSYTSPSHLYIMGGSAGGLLMGAVLNKRPDLFRAVIALVPFVDCLTTMLDENIPLSTLEYEEWGNPNDKKYYDYMKSYSPYNNVKKIKYPPVFIQTGYHDPRVQYWEPAKWTAKLRENKTDENLLLLLTNMDSGHFGSSGRLEILKQYALYYAFLIGIEKVIIG